MEAGALKKILIYSAIAMVLGLALTLSPLIVLTKIETENNYLIPSEALDQEQLEKLKELWGLGKPKYSIYSIADVEILFISLAVASTVYVIFKRRMFTS